MQTSFRFEISVDTATGSYIRRVPEASPIPESSSPGHTTEEAVIRASALWGLPDFLFRSSNIHVGSGMREIGDGLIIAPPYAAVIQVKARTAVSDTPLREKSWLDKNISKAQRQVVGTLRRLHSMPHQITNLRGQDVEVRAEDFDWIGITILEHGKVPSSYFPEVSVADCVVLLRADWEFLWDQLKSTVEVMRYLRRVTQYQPTKLGFEPFRYYELASADEASPETEFPHEWIERGGFTKSTPLLPLAPAGQEINHFIFRQILEDLARAPSPPGFDRLQILRSLAIIDSLPIALREEWGPLVLENLMTLPESEDGIRWWSRRIARNSPSTPQIFLMTCSQPIDDMIQDVFEMRVRLVHDQWIQTQGDAGVTPTVALLLTPSLRPTRPWEITMVTTDNSSRLPVEERGQYEQIWANP